MKLDHTTTEDTLASLTRVFGVFNINVTLVSEETRLRGIDGVSSDAAFKVEGKGREYLILSERGSRGFSAYRMNNGKVYHMTSAGSPKSLHRMFRECVTSILADIVDDQW